MFRFASFLSCAFLFAWLVWPQPAGAEDGRSCVAIVHSESDDPLLMEATVRLRAEMRSNGMEVIEVTRAHENEGIENKEDMDCLATVELQSDSYGASAIVWLSEEQTDNAEVRRFEVQRTADAAGMLAIHVLELLRASLLKISSPSDSETPEELSLVQPLSSTKESNDRFSIGLGALGLFGTEGLGFSVGPGLCVGYNFTRHFLGRLSMAATFLGSEPENDEGRAILHQEFASLGVSLGTGTRPVEAFGWLGVGVYNLHVEGIAKESNSAASDNVVSFLMDAGLGAKARISKWFALTVDAGVIFLIPQPVVKISDKDTGVAGAPSVSVSIGALIFVK